jgi:hypothetical protein
VVAIDAGVPSLSSTAHVWVTGMATELVYFVFEMLPLVAVLIDILQLLGFMKLDQQRNTDTKAKLAN